MEEWKSGRMEEWKNGRIPATIAYRGSNSILEE
jgi:hypothetical protein